LDFSSYQHPQKNQTPLAETLSFLDAGEYLLSFSESFWQDLFSKNGHHTGVISLF
jgi:hypothetical protein